MGEERVTPRMSGPRSPGTERHNRGFTLIELLVVLSIQGILLGAVVTSFTGQLTAYDLQEQLNAMQQNARAAMTMVLREARMAGYDPTRTGAAGLSYDPAGLRFVADRNGDGDFSDANENVLYTHDPVRLRLRRGTGGGAQQPLAEDVQAFTVEYFDAMGNPTTATPDIRRIRITVTTRTSKRDPRYPLNGGYRTHTLRSFLTPANLGL